MFESTVKRGLMIDFAGDDFSYPEAVNQKRVYKLNEKDIKSGKIVYVATREHRLEDNWGFLYALELSKEMNQDLLVFIYLDEDFYSERQKTFMFEGIKSFKENLEKNNIKFQVLEDGLSTCLKGSGAIIVDFNPVHSIDNLVSPSECAAFEVDSHNIIPARFISNKQEFSAAHLRRKIYINISEFLTEYPNNFDIEKNKSYLVLENFIENKLDNYDELRNNPNLDFTSRLSKYLHFGQMSVQRVVLEIIKSKASKNNKEAFLEELIVRKELADNFCFYNKDYKSFNAIPDWAQETLNAHRNDIRAYTYSLEEFESYKTHDELWNKAQEIMVKKGYMHGYLRMYWAKKILEWSTSPEEAIKTAIYLNDKYELDGDDPNGYAGILWSIGGLHDRPFANRMITGKIRYMSYEGCKRKFDVDKYINS